MEVKEEVALKLIKPEIAQEEATIERSRNELKVARKVSHRNVYRMHDLGKAEEGYFISMEYVRGEDLRSSINRFGQLSIGKSISMCSKENCFDNAMMESFFSSLKKELVRLETFHSKEQTWRSVFDTSRFSTIINGGIQP
jgi:serine/threonine protein kinase